MALCKILGGLKGALAIAPSPWLLKRPQKWDPGAGIGGRLQEASQQCYFEGGVQPSHQPRAAARQMEWVLDALCLIQNGPHDKEETLAWAWLPQQNLQKQYSLSNQQQICDLIFMLQCPGRVCTNCVRHNHPSPLSTPLKHHNLWHLPCWEACVVCKAIST